MSAPFREPVQITIREFLRDKRREEKRQRKQAAVQGHQASPRVRHGCAGKCGKLIVGKWCKRCVQVKGGQCSRCKGPIAVWNRSKVCARCMHA